MDKAFLDMVARGMARNLVVYDDAAAPGTLSDRFLRLLVRVAGEDRPVDLYLSDVPVRVVEGGYLSYAGGNLYGMQMGPLPASAKAAYQAQASFPSFKEELAVAVLRSGEVLLGAY